MCGNVIAIAKIETHRQFKLYMVLYNMLYHHTGQTQELTVKTNMYSRASAAKLATSSIPRCRPTAQYKQKSAIQRRF